MSVYIVCPGMLVYTVCTLMSTPFAQSCLHYLDSYICLNCFQVSVSMFLSRIFVYTVCPGMFVYTVCTVKSVYKVCQSVLVYTVCTAMAIHAVCQVVFVYTVTQ